MSALVRWGLPAAATAFVAPIAAAGWLIFAPQRGAAVVEGAGGVARSLSSPAAGSLDPLAGAAEKAAPFRPDGRPSRVAYDPARTATPDYAPPKPALTVSGLVDGAVPLVVLEGVPGRDGPVLLGVGDTLAGLKIRRIKGGSVTITGMDTTWVLTIRRLP
jgi:hypothetical protein